MRHAALLALLALGLLGAKSDPLAGRVAGPPAACIDLHRVQAPQILDPGTILYRQSGKRVWRVTPVGRCVTLRPLATLVVEPFGGQLCRNDRFRVLEFGQTIPSAPCRFGSFVPYDRP